LLSKFIALAIAGAASAATPQAASTTTAPTVHYARVGNSVQAWYATVASNSTCLPLIGCLPISTPAIPSPYPAGTLHVGLTAGVETARSYLVPNLGKLKAHAVPKSGTLILPVDGSLLDGSLSVTTADIKACLTVGKLPAKPSATEAAGGALPKVNCKVSATATYDAADNRFSISLDKFLKRWQNGAPKRGVALIAVPHGSAALDNWSVTIGGKNAKPTAVSTIVGYVLTASKQVVKPVHHQHVPPPAPDPGIVAPAVTVPDNLPPVSTTTTTPPVGTPQIAPNTVPAAGVFYRSGKFRYPMVFLAPLAILAGLLYFSRLFTATTVRPRRAGKTWSTS
jgi:hypothetical protein